MLRQRAAAAAAILMMVTSACAADTPETSTSVDMTLAAGSTQPSDDDMADMSDSDTMSDEETHEQDHSTETLVEWPADRELPTIELTTEPGDDGTVIAIFDVTGFAVVGGDPADVAEGAGHLHVSVDGHTMEMVFEPEISLDGLAPGPHVLEIGLAAGEHDVYAQGGEPIRYTASFEVPGQVADADVAIELTLDDQGVQGGIVKAAASVGDLVEIRVDSAIAEELHVHVYDVAVDLVPGEPAVLRFSADIPGVFEAELEGSGLQVLSLTVS